MKLSLEPAIHLLHEAPYATLATHAAQLPGYPYATVVPLAVDETHRPLLLISALAEHTKNILADSRVSLSLLEAGATDVQSAGRMTLIGDAERFTPSPPMQARYLRCQPAAAQYLELDFMWFCIRPKRIRHIAGIGRMGWIEAADWAQIPPLALAEEAELLAAVNDDMPAGMKIIGFDRYGADYLSDGCRYRLRFADAPLADAQIPSTVKAMSASRCGIVEPPPA